jgi:ribosomal protein S18 acetylase RimI-like enzyme
MTPRLRPYESDDWDRLCVIHDRSRMDELVAVDMTEAFLALDHTAQNEGLFDGQVVVAEIDGEVLGFMAFTREELSWLYVDPAAYRRGIGRALVRHAIRHSAGKLLTEVLVGNERALQLYLSEGFSLVKRVDGHLVGNDRFAASAYLLQHIRK